MNMYGLHQGYIYQDLLTAFLISENLQRKDFKVGVEYKESANDMFDDIVLITDGNKTKFQVKHSAINQKIESHDFTKPTSNLSLSKLAKSLSPKEKVRYVIATNRKVQLSPFFSQQEKQKTISLQNKTLLIRSAASSQKQFIKQLIIESDLPNASFDLSRPGSLEMELLESLRIKVGIGYYPNNQVTARDVAGRLILLASKLRASKKPELIDKKYIFKYISLNFEYGHIAQNFPFISSEHRLYRTQVVAKIKDLISKNKFAILEGSPGSGKSHIFDDLFKDLTKEKVAVARHFCYLEPTDQLAQERIVVDAMYGNFLHQLEKLEPELAKQVKPYFAATKTNVEKLIEKISQSGKKVILMVDGLDHLNRVAAQNKLPPDLVDNFVSVLSEINLPIGCSIFIASQPSAELSKIIKEKRAGVHILEAWDRKLVREFTTKHNDHLAIERRLDITDEAIKLLTEKTEGNALYLTYVLLQIVSSNTKVNFFNFIQDLPRLSKNLNNYYKYLAKNITPSDFVVVQTLALLDFSVSRGELGEMFPPIQKRSINITLDKIRPILKPGSVQGGMRIYHESFRRFVIEQKQTHGQKDRVLYKHITGWLENKGFFLSQRSFRYLIPYLIRSNAKEKIYELLGKDFVAQGLFYFHSKESIVANLNMVADYSAHKQRWDIYCKAVELRRALHTYSEERFDSVNDVYHQAILSVHGADLFCERLLFDGKRVFEKTYGILLCQMAEHAGGKPPWDYYDVAGVSMQVGETSQIQHFQNVEAAHFLNLIRNSSDVLAIKMLRRLISRNKFKDTEQRQIELLLKEFDFVFGVTNSYQSLLGMGLSKNKKVILTIEVAKVLRRNGQKTLATKLATSLIRKTSDISQILELVSLGAKPPAIRHNLFKLTNKVVGFGYIYDNEVPIFREWYLVVQILSHKSPNVVNSAKNLVTTIDGWYRAWILYLFELSQLEASAVPTVKKEVALEKSLEKLILYTHPFRGQPRAMDLYSIREFSSDSFRRTLQISRGFSNYPKIISLLSNISQRSTSYLQGSSSGPLDGESLNILLKESYPLMGEDNKARARKLIEDNTIDGTGSSIYYDSAAFEYLKLATVLSLNKSSLRSKQRLMDGCIRLVGYGHRKDITIYEIIEPIKFIAKKDLKFATEAFKKSYPLVETVWRHTDGKETRHALVYWLKAMVDSDKKLAIQTMSEMVKEDPKRDWRMEKGTEHLCRLLLESDTKTEIVSDLYETIRQADNVDFDVSVGLIITSSLLKEGNLLRAQQVFEFVCRTLYWVSTTEYVYRKENYDDILSFSKDNNLKINDGYKSHFITESLKPNNYSSLTSLRQKTPKIPRFKFSKLSLFEIHRLVDDYSSSYFLHRNNVINFGIALSKFKPTHSDEVRHLILSLVRRGLYDNNDTNGLVQLRDTFKKRRKKDLAAFVSMLGFVYARGGGGWYALADSKYNHLGRDAFSLSRIVAEKTLASEMSYLFSKATYFVGPVRHLIEFLPGNGKNRMAKSIWNNAYEVINFRLPAHPDLEKKLQSETPTFNYIKNFTVVALLKDLIKNRKNITV